jgi:hypothetical protein
MSLLIEQQQEGISKYTYLMHVDMKGAISLNMYNKLQTKRVPRFYGCIKNSLLIRKSEAMIRPNENYKILDTLDEYLILIKKNQKEKPIVIDGNEKNEVIDKNNYSAKLELFNKSLNDINNDKTQFNINRKEEEDIEKEELISEFNIHISKKNLLNFNSNNNNIENNENKLIEDNKLNNEYKIIINDENNKVEEIN